jgi:SOS-response transcriptional repressor LexA
MTMYRPSVKPESNKKSLTPLSPHVTTCHQGSFVSEKHFGIWLRRQIEETLLPRRKWAKTHDIPFDTLKVWLPKAKPDIRGTNLVKLAKALGKPREEIEAMLGIVEPDENVEPFSEHPIGVEPPFFDLPIAASGWVSVTDNQDGGYHVSPAQIAQGLFRVRVRGDSMQPKFPDGCIVEFKLMRTPEGVPDCGAVIVGKRYYVQLDDGTGTFKELAEYGADGLTLRAINRKYKKLLIAPLDRIQRLAVLKGTLIPED